MTNPKLLEQFRSFYARNYPDDMETQIEYFSIFGGLSLDIDTQKTIPHLLHELIFTNFEEISKNIRELTLDNQNNKRLLRALAIGDRRIFSAFNRAGLNNGNGGGALNYLQEKGLIQIEYSREDKSKNLNSYLRFKKETSKHRISHKVLFTYPFIRFWFYFIAPHYKELENKQYDNFFKDLSLKKNSYTSLIFEELSEMLLNYNLRDAQILSSGSYWDANVEIDILTITMDKRVYVAECKWTNHKVNKKELHKLMEKCEKLDIEPTQILLFSKRGFSKELKLNQGKSLALYTSTDFNALVKNTKAKKTTKYLFQ